jgi:hypothetical protein
MPPKQAKQIIPQSRKNRKPNRSDSKAKRNIKAGHELIGRALTDLPLSKKRTYLQKEAEKERVSRSLSERQKSLSVDVREKT